MAKNKTPSIDKGTLLTMKGLILVESVIIKKRNHQLAAAFFLSTYIGCKPGQMKSVEEIRPHIFQIHSKNTLSTRCIRVDSKHMRSRLNLSIKALFDAKIRQVQDNFSTLMKASFGNCRAPTLSALRVLFIRRVQAKQISLHEKELLTGLSVATLTKYPATQEVDSEIIISSANLTEKRTPKIAYSKT